MSIVDALIARHEAETAEAVRREFTVPALYGQLAEQHDELIALARELEGQADAMAYAIHGSGDVEYVSVCVACEYKKFRKERGG